MHAAPAEAQVRSISPYAFIAPGVVCCAGNLAFVHAGGGVEAGLTPRASVSGEAGWILTVDEVEGALLWSVNGLYHLTVRRRSLSPFITAGYAMLVSDESTGYLNGGLGVEYTARRNLGLRLEVRGHLDSRGPYHFVTGRLSVVFK